MRRDSEDRQNVHSWMCSYSRWKVLKSGRVLWTHSMISSDCLCACRWAVLLLSILSALRDYQMWRICVCGIDLSYFSFSFQFQFHLRPDSLYELLSHLLQCDRNMGKDVVFHQTILNLLFNLILFSCYRSVESPYYMWDFNFLRW
jgi:hypothetical protein